MKIAVVQLDCKINRASGNLRRAERLIEQAMEAGAEIVCLPESFVSSGNVLDVAEVASAIPGVETEALAAIARKHAAHIVAGLYEKDVAQHFSTAIVIDPAGAIVARYRRAHCFEMERRYLDRGEEFCIVDTPKGRIGLLLGYDLRFPESFRILYQQKVDVIFCLALVPEQFAYVTHQLLRARAIENQCYVVFASGVGTNPYAGFSYMGESGVIADPLFLEAETFDFVDGDEVLLRMNREEGVGLAEVDVPRLRNYREANSLVGDTRPALYRAALGDVELRAEAPQ